jgi:hypothetical protein
MRVAMLGFLWFSLAWAQPAKVYRLDSLIGLEPVNVKPQIATYRGHRAVHVVDIPGTADAKTAGGNTIAVLTDSDFKDGTIEVDVSGTPGPGASDTARGFVGIAFRVQLDRSRYECFYLRPTNGRAGDQLRRNHSTQYVSEPEFPWQRLRQETPGVYESYTDLEPGAWTHMKIVVAGVQARLYVNRAAQPCLVVRDMKHGETHGHIALWIGLGTDAYFSRLTVK